MNFLRCVVGSLSLASSPRALANVPSRPWRSRGRSPAARSSWLKGAPARRSGRVAGRRRRGDLVGHRGVSCKSNLAPGPSASAGHARENAGPRQIIGDCVARFGKSRKHRAAGNWRGHRDPGARWLSRPRQYLPRACLPASGLPRPCERATNAGAPLARRPCTA